MVLKVQIKKSFFYKIKIIFFYLYDQPMSNIILYIIGIVKIVVFVEG